MKSRRGVFAAVALLLALPVAVLGQVLFGASSETVQYGNGKQNPTAQGTSPVKTVSPSQQGTDQTISVSRVRPASEHPPDGAPGRRPDGITIS